MTLAQRVLVVDGLAETEEVLRAVLEPQGHTVDRIRMGTGEIAGENLAAKRRPSVVVLHVEEGPAQLPAAEGWQDVPRIVISATKTDGYCRGDVDHHLEKPFQYGELIRTIERLLAAVDG